METLQILLSLAGIAAHAGMVAIVCFAFIRLKRQEEDLKGLKIVTARTLALVTGEHLRASFEVLNDMKEMLHDLIDDECFEEAERLKAHIAKVEQDTMRELERFKENFGEDCVDVMVTNIRKED